ncbi:MAG: hypothetical protein AAGC46_20935 [Solirubrobacteraceae bacterium]
MNDAATHPEITTWPGNASLIAAPPWTLRGQAVVLITVARRRAALDPGEGRFGTVAFIDYAESDVGPYRELLRARRWVRAGGRIGPNVDPIWVTSEASAVSGRANWGLSKLVATIDRDPAAAGGAETWIARDAHGPLGTLRHRPVGRALGVAKPGWLGRMQTLAAGQLFHTPITVRGTVRRTQIDTLSLDPERVIDLGRHRVVAAFAITDGLMTFHAADVQPAPR